MKKKLLALTLCLAMTATMLSGCGGSKDTASEEATTEPTAQEETTTDEAAAPADDAADDTAAVTTGCPGVEGLDIGVCIYKFDDNFMTLYRNELQTYLEDGGASVTIMDGKNDQAEQTNQIQNFITEGVDVLIVNLVQASAAEQITDQCNAAGIPLVFINREPDDTEKQRWTDNSIKATYVGADAKQSGTYQGEIVLALPDKGDINGDGTISYVMVIGDPENVDAQYRTEFSIKALTEAGMKVEELDAQRGDWDQARGQEIVANALTANGDAVEVVFCNNDAMALGARQAIEAAGRTVGTDIYLLGVDALTDALEGVINGTITGTVFNDHIGQSHAAAEAAASFAAGETLDTLIGVDYIKVTQDNAQEILDLLQ
ncbi:MAG: galactose ABC transporter substrate-binding protein [Velocimicrobium sp.]